MGITTHRVLTRVLFGAWASYAPVLGMILACFGSFVMFWVAVGVHAAYPINAIGFSAATAVAVMTLGLVTPVADITDQCQAYVGKSIRTAAEDFYELDMELDTQLAFVSFVQYLDRTPTGVRIPGIGQVDYAFLGAKLSIMGTVLPLALAVSAQIFVAKAET